MNDSASDTTRRGEEAPARADNQVNVEKAMPPSAQALGHNLSPMDPDSPMSWPLWKKLYTSFVAFSFSWVV